MQFDPSSIFLVEIFRFPELSLCRQIISHFTQQWTLQDAHWNTVERTPVLHFSSFFFSKLHADRYEATTEVASRQWPWESAWANRGAEHFSPHSSIIHLRPSPLVRFLFYSSLDFCVHSRSVSIHSNSRRLLAGSGDAAQNAASSCAHQVYSTCTPISNLDAYPHTRVLHVGMYVFARTYAPYRPVGEHLTWAWHYRECNIKLK